MSSTAPSTGRLASAFLAEWIMRRRWLASYSWCVPADKFDWKPHEKSMTFWPAGRSRRRDVRLDKETLTQDVLDFATADFTPFSSPAPMSNCSAFFDDHIAKAKAYLAETPDETFFTEWTMRNGGAGIFYDAKGRRDAVLGDQPPLPAPADPWVLADAIPFCRSTAAATTKVMRRESTVEN